MTDEQLLKIQWLNRAFHINNKIKALEETLKQNRSIAERCTASYENSGGSSGSHDNSQEKIIHQLIDEENKIRSQFDELISIRDEIKGAITSLNNDEYETILYMRYLAYKKTQEIADTMHYDRKTIYRKYIKALDLINVPLNAPNIL